MNFKLYNYLRFMGVPAEEATELASNGKLELAVDMYEQKPTIDNANRGGFTHVIGLKEEFKQAAIQH